MRAECHGRPGTWQDRARAGRAGHCSRGRSQFRTGWEKSREAGKGGSSWHISIQQRVKLRLQSVRAAVPTPTASTPQWRQLPRQADHLSVGLIWPLFPSHSQASLSKGWPLLSARVGVCVQEGIREGPGKPQRPSPAPCSSIILAKPSPIFPTRNLPSGKPGVWVVWDLGDDLHSPLPLPESGQGSHPLQAQSQRWARAGVWSQEPPCSAPKAPAGSTRAAPISGVAPTPCHVKYLGAPRGQSTAND